MPAEGSGQAASDARVARRWPPTSILAMALGVDPSALAACAHAARTARRRWSCWSRSRRRRARLRAAARRRARPVARTRARTRSSPTRATTRTPTGGSRRPSTGPAATGRRDAPSQRLVAGRAAPLRRRSIASPAASTRSRPRIAVALLGAADGAARVPARPPSRRARRRRGRGACWPRSIPTFIDNNEQLLSEPIAAFTLTAAVLGFLWAAGRGPRRPGHGCSRALLLGATALARPEYLPFVAVLGLLARW